MSEKQIRKGMVGKKYLSRNPKTSGVIGDYQQPRSVYDSFVKNKKKSDTYTGVILHPDVESDKKAIKKLLKIGEQA
mgnify:CR=1 FL=1